MIPRLRRGAPDPARCGLAFDEPGGPVVVVSGLVGGSGTTILAYALARQAARESRAPVLLSEYHAAAGGLTAITGASSPLGLTALAARMAAGQPPETAFAEPEPRLRVVASAPTRPAELVADHIDALITEARAAHGLVVIDGGPAAHLPAALLSHATQVIWTLAATPTGAVRAAGLLAGDALPPPGAWRELCVAFAPPSDVVSVRILRRIVRARCERLVLVPYARSEPLLASALTALAQSLREAR